MFIECYLHILIRLYVYIHMCTHTCMCTHMRIYSCMHTCMYIYVCAFLCQNKALWLSLNNSPETNAENTTYNQYIYWCISNMVGQIQTKFSPEQNDKMAITAFKMIIRPGGKKQL